MNRTILIARILLSAFLKGKQRIPMVGLPPGRLLDIGGGGEGVVAQLAGARVVAADKMAAEIREAQDKAPDAQWLVADAAALPFKTGSFEAATAFFSCMYMPGSVKHEVFRETRRVLKPAGQFWIWDAVMRAKPSLFGIRIRVDLPGGEEIETTYGAGAKDQSAPGFQNLLEEAGFAVEVAADSKRWFALRAEVPGQQSPAWR
jgi:ubiquinone/menaquinone biosynthesis C-methylase UbiE